MAVFVLEDLAGAIEVTVFPRVLQDQGHRLANDAIVARQGPDRPPGRVPARVHGPGHHRRRQPRRLGERAAPPAHPRRRRCRELKIHQLRRILRDHPGDSPVFLHLGPTDGTPRCCASPTSSASTSTGSSPSCASPSATTRSRRTDSRAGGAAPASTTTHALEVVAGGPTCWLGPLRSSVFPFVSPLRVLEDAVRAATACTIDCGNGNPVVPA